MDLYVASKSKLFGNIKNAADSVTRSGWAVFLRLIGFQQRNERTIHGWQASLLVNDTTMKQ